MNKENNFSIRLMSILDYEEVYSMWMRCKNMGFNDVDDSKSGISKYLTRNPTTCFVSESCTKENKKIISGVILTGHDGRRGYVHHMAVDPDYRKQGIASALVEKALESLKNEGISKVALVAFKYNEVGNAFWEKMGFTQRTDLVYRNKALVALKRLDT